MADAAQSETIEARALARTVAAPEPGCGCTMKIAAPSATSDRVVVPIGPNRPISGPSGNWECNSILPGADHERPNFANAAPHPATMAGDKARKLPAAS